MEEEFFREEKIAQSEKEIEWERRQEEIEHTADSLGEPIDERIKKTVVALNVSGLPTSASCEGHIDFSTGAPWVDIEAPGQPKWRFVGEEQVFQGVAEKYGVSIEDVRRALHYEARKEAARKTSGEETEKYKQWRERNKELAEKMSRLLEEFYKEREVAPGVRLTISEWGEGGFRVNNGEQEDKFAPKEFSKEEKGRRAQLLPRYQQEMEEFTEFLRQKYFSEQ